MQFRNYYHCPQCGHPWSDVWPAQCEDDCRECGARHISPYKSEDVVEPGRSKRIAQLNDTFRKTLSGGQVLVTPGVSGLPPMVLAEAVRRTTEFADFSTENDPYGEHDFGSFELCSRRFFWKIDYYDTACEAGSEDPADPKKTTRVLTLMLASEY